MCEQDAAMLWVEWLGRTPHIGRPLRVIEEMDAKKSKTAMLSKPTDRPPV